MNKVILIGNLTRDAEVFETKAGKSACKFSIAVQRDFKDADGNLPTDFFNGVLWGDHAAKMAGYMTKGKKIAVEGRVQNRTYEDKDGQKRTVTEIFCQPGLVSYGQGFINISSFIRYRTVGNPFRLRDHSRLIVILTSQSCQYQP